MRTLTCLALALLLCGGCNKKKDGGTPATGSGPGMGTGAGSGSGEGASGWAELLGVSRAGGSGSLADVIKGFPGYDTCVERLERTLPPDLTADMLPGYDLTDALCRTREALAKETIGSCSRVVSYSLKKGCETMFAMYRRKPELCPAEYPTRLGRNGYCLAVAERNLTMCAGARSDEDEARCRAILSRDDAPCGAITTRAELRQRCKAESRRWAAVMTDVKPAAAGFKAGLELSLKSTSTVRPCPFEKVKPSCAEQGAVVPTYGDSAKVVLCNQLPYSSYRYSSSLGQRYDSPEYRTKLNFEFRPPASDSAKLSFGTGDVLFQLRITGYEELSGTQTGELQFQKFERRRGGRVKGSFKVTIEQAGERVTVEGSFDTFVRDLVEPMTLAGNPYGYGGSYGSALGAGGSYGSGYRGVGTGLGTGSGAGAGVLGSLGGRTPPAPTAKRYAGVLTSASLLAEKKGTQVIGYRVRSIQPASIWERLGVQEDDLVMQVGAAKLQRTDDLVRIRTELRDVKRLVIKIKRGKKQQALSLGPAQLKKLHDEFDL